MHRSPAPTDIFPAGCTFSIDLWPSLLPRRSDEPSRRSVDLLCDVDALDTAPRRRRVLCFAISSRPSEPRRQSHPLPSDSRPFNTPPHHYSHPHRFSPRSSQLSTALQFQPWPSPDHNHVSPPLTIPNSAVLTLQLTTTANSRPFNEKNARFNLPPPFPLFANTHHCTAQTATPNTSTPLQPCP